MDITEVKEVVTRYNSLMHSLLGGIKRALEGHPNDPTQATIQKELKDAIAVTQSQIAGLDVKIVHLSDEIMDLATKFVPHKEGDS